MMPIWAWALIAALAVAAVITAIVVPIVVKKACSGGSGTMVYDKCSKKWSGTFGVTYVTSTGPSPFGASWLGDAGVNVATIPGTAPLPNWTVLGISWTSGVPAPVPGDVLTLGGWGSVTGTPSQALPSSFSLITVLWNKSPSQASISYS